MKFTISTLMLIVFVTTISSAQFETGTVELSLTAMAGSQKEALSGQGFSSSSRSLGFAFLNGSFGYYVFDGFSIEPQIGLLAIEEMAPSQSILLNLSYATRISESNIALFGKAGYGVGNALSIITFGNTPFRVSNKWDVTVLNIGAGVKILLSQVIALRLEANYRRENSPSNIPPTQFIFRPDVVLTNIGLQVGFSVLL